MIATKNPAVGTAGLSNVVVLAGRTQVSPKHPKPQQHRGPPSRPMTREAAFAALLETSRASDRLLAEARDHKGATAIACRALASRYHARAVHLSGLVHALPGEVTA